MNAFFPDPSRRSDDDEDDEALERELFARRASVDVARPPFVLDVDDVLARVESKKRRARVFDVARVLTLANAFAAAAACLALMRGVPAEATSLDVARDDAPNMTPIALRESDGSLACRSRIDVPLGSLVCTGPAAASMSSMSSMSMLVDETLACTDAVTCGGLGP